MKKALSILLSIVMILSAFTVIPVEVTAKEADVVETGTSKTADEALAWVRSLIGQTVGSGQCVALINAYYSYLGVSPVTGNGGDYTWNALPSGWQRLQGVQPQAGDILVYTDGGYGHVGIYESDRVTYHQNFGYNQTVQKVTYAYNGLTVTYWGVIRPNFAGSAPSIPNGSQTISDGEYHIVSMLDDNMNIDVFNGSLNNGANIHFYHSVNDFKQVFDVTYLGNGSYKIINQYSGKSLDCAGAGTTAGTNLQQWEYTGETQQQWIIQETGDGVSFYIISKKSGLYIDVDNASTTDGSNIKLYTGNQSKAQRWRFVTWGENVGKSISEGEYHIASNLNTSMCLDVYNANTSNNTNIDLFTNITTPEQVFVVTFLGNGYYKIINKNSGKSLCLQDAKCVKGTNILQYDYSDEGQKQWVIKRTADGKAFNIISKNGGLCIDVNNGEAKNYTNIQGYIANGTKAQEWLFIPWVENYEPSIVTPTNPSTDPPTVAPTTVPTLPPTETPTVALTEPPTEAPTVPPVITPTAVKLNKTSVSLAYGKTCTLTATVSPSNAVNKAVTWSTSNKAVATVSAKGVVTAKGAGTATITAKTANGKTASCKVTVTLAAPKITKLTNTAAGVQITIGKVSGAVKYRYLIKSGKTWKKLGDSTGTTFVHKAAKSGAKYTYSVCCISKDGKQAFSSYNKTGWAATFIGTPSLPTLKNTKNGVQIGIKKVAGAAKYRILRKTGKGKWAKVADTTKLSYVDKTAKKGIVYTYTICCVSANGKAATSAYNTKGRAIRCIR